MDVLDIIFIVLLFHIAGNIYGNYKIIKLLQKLTEFNDEAN